MVGTDSMEMGDTRVHDSEYYSPPSIHQGNSRQAPLKVLTLFETAPDGQAEFESDQDDDDPFEEIRVLDADLV